MTDRELLELAAKAAGVPGKFVEKHPEDGHPAYSCGIGRDGIIPLWNPLQHSGDTFNLAVDCDMVVSVDATENRARVILREGMNPVCEEPLDSDARAATRRAVTRAAAEIGKHAK